MVNTIAWTTPHTGIHQQHKFIRKGIAELCDRLEKQFKQRQAVPRAGRGRGLTKNRHCARAAAHMGHRGHMGGSYRPYGSDMGGL